MSTPTTLLEPGWTTAGALVAALRAISWTPDTVVSFGYTQLTLDSEHAVDVALNEVRLARRDDDASRALALDKIATRINNALGRIDGATTDKARDRHTATLTRATLARDKALARLLAAQAAYPAKLAAAQAKAKRQPLTLIKRQARVMRQLYAHQHKATPVLLTHNGVTLRAVMDVTRPDGMRRQATVYLTLIEVTS